MNTRVSRNFQTGRLDNINKTTATQFQQFPGSSNLICRQGIFIFADSGNPGAVWVGNQGVTVFGAGVNSSGTDGFPLRPGERVDFNIDNASGLFFLSDQGTTNRIFWFAR